MGDRLERYPHFKEKMLIAAVGPRTLGDWTENDKKRSFVLFSLFVLGKWGTLQTTYFFQI
jgi:hypothetical protein